MNQPMTLSVKDIIYSINLPNKPSYDSIIAELKRAITTNPEGQISEKLTFNETLDGQKKTTPLSPPRIKL
jgi:hypothetical protein